MFRTPFVLNKPYLVLDPLALEHLELSKDFNIEVIKEHSKIIAFDELSTLVFWINGDYAQYAVASKEVSGLKAMSAFCCDKSTENTTKREDICIYQDLAEVKKVRELLEQYDDLHTLKLFSGSTNEGILLDLPNEFGAEQNGKIIAAYLIKEKSKFRATVKPVLLSKDAYQRYQESLANDESLFNTVDEFFIER